MPYGLVDDKLHSSIKWRMATKGGRALWITALSWCMDQLTDGHVPKGMLRMLDGSPADARSLVTVGLWETADGGWQFHDWQDYQPDAASIRAKREKESDGGREGNHVRWHVRRKLHVPECEFCQADPVFAPSGTRSEGRSGLGIGGESSPAPAPSPSTYSSKKRPAPPVTRDPDEPPPDDDRPEFDPKKLLASAGLAQSEVRDFLVDLKAGPSPIHNTTAFLNALYRDGKLTARIAEWRTERDLASEAASRPAKPSRVAAHADLVQQFAAQEAAANVVPIRQIEGA